MSKETERRPRICGVKCNQRIVAGSGQRPIRDGHWPSPVVDLMSLLFLLLLLLVLTTAVAVFIVQQLAAILCLCFLAACHRCKYSTMIVSPSDGCCVLMLSVSVSVGDFLRSYSRLRRRTAVFRYRVRWILTTCDGLQSRQGFGPWTIFTSSFRWCVALRCLSLIYPEDVRRCRSSNFYSHTNLIGPSADRPTNILACTITLLYRTRTESREFRVRRYFCLVDADSLLADDLRAMNPVRIMEGNEL